MSSEAVIRASNLGKRFEIFSSPSDRLLHMLTSPVSRALGSRAKSRGREVWAVRNVDFDVVRGETLGIVGRNGSGKSTLLQMICGTLSPTEGDFSLSGRIAALLELGAGFNPEFTGRENVLLNGMLLGLSRDAVESRFDEIAAFADIGQYIDEPTKTYSSGMFVRLAFAVATSVDADVLIVDEALAVGDARFQARCMKRIRQIQDGGASVLFVSHDVSTVRTLCQRALWLDSGRMRMLGPVLQVTSRYMESIFADDPDASPDRPVVEGVAADAAGDGPEVGEVAAGAEEPTEAEAETERVSDLGDGSPVHSPDEYDQMRHVVESAPAGIDSRPVSHWGEQVGLIESAEILDGDGQPLDLARWGECCRIRIRFSLPHEYSPETFGVAFSIKDLKGSDIIVSSSHDRDGGGDMHWSADERVTVEFEFENGLVEGKYFLVAALERRTGPVVEYYEYLEGARYFSSVADKRYFGVYQPRISHSYSESTRVG
ncbi:ABC transporter ATP-binding protein [Pseudoxanthomonas daejeonensis]|uniref:Sugar ABC transporter ATP-binding protein n=1 Tax=Pseudoxanthomonas daejeonensis TaxID=266062 RepID=A0ABQ6ZB42_9GAMM|nr:ABC transporter ATP-binding protein [Pseudoxanthomonas daejeonensis]KAF1696954.1 sugar ABC transporter ATP-binding protein [Pseudoxanthomonas daejeonensis]